MPTIEEINRETKQGLVIVKSHVNQNTKHITIPSSNLDIATINEMASSIWSELSQGIDSLFENGISSINCAKLYQEAERYCRIQNPKSLYDLLIPQLQEIVNNFITTISSDLDLNGISNLIQIFEQKMNYLRRIFSYLDRGYIYAKRVEGNLSLNDLIYSILRHSLQENKECIDHILTQIQLEINIFRCEENTSKTFIKTAIDFFDHLGFYDELIEPMICDQSKDYYSSISQELTLLPFIEWLNHSLTKEKELIDVGVKQSTYKLVMMIIRQTCLESNVSLIFGNEFCENLEAQNGNVIQNIYQFFDDDSIRHLFHENLANYYVQYSKKLLETDDITEIIRGYYHSYKFINEIFPGNDIISKILTKSFSQSFLPKSDHLAKLFAIHMDKCQPITKSDREFLKLSRSKSTFESAYSYLLIKRIFSWIPFNIDREKKLVKVFKKIAGPDYTNRLEMILKDLVISKEVNFDGENFQAVILSSEVFPNTSFDKVNFPDFVRNDMEKFSEIYFQNQKNQRKVINWSSKLSMVFGQICGVPCKMNGNQAVILLSAQNGGKTLSELAHETGISEDELRDELALLMSKESCFLIVQDENNYYQMNDNPQIITNKDGVLELPELNASKIEKERASLESNIEYIQNNQMLCEIITKLKVFKVLPLSDLYNKVLKVLSFEPGTVKFLNCIKDLEKKGFIERCGEKQYKYLP